MTLILHAKDAAPAFQLKGGIYTLTTLELHVTDEPALKRQLSAMVRKAPRFFQQTPVVLALDKLPAAEKTLNLSSIRHLLHQSGLLLVAVRGGSEHYKKDASVCGIAWLPPQRPKAKTERDQEKSDQPSAKNIVMMKPYDNSAAVDSHESETTQLELPESRIINRPVRSGQQVYSPGDLIVLGQVSTGAELLAGGHIHVYGPLRGRALAGVNGNISARIFCTRFEAELVSISGQYKLPGKSTSGSPWSGRWGRSAQVTLKDNSLQIGSLS
ncbi:MAG: septum site-determining protein MinC [Endozoicomonas sp.]